MIHKRREGSLKMKKSGIAIKGFRLRDGKIVRDLRRLDVSARLRQKSSQKVKVKRRGE